MLTKLLKLWQVKNYISKKLKSVCLKGYIILRHTRYNKTTDCNFGIITQSEHVKRATFLDWLKILHTFIVFWKKLLKFSREWLSPIDRVLLVDFQVIYQAWDAVFYHQMKHQEESGKYDAQQSIFWQTSRCLIWSGNETLWQMLDYFSNKMILEGEIKDAKNDQFFIWFPNTHLTLISFVFSLWIINEIEKKK